MPYLHVTVTSMLEILVNLRLDPMPTTRMKPTGHSWLWMENLRSNTTSSVRQHWSGLGLESFVSLYTQAASIGSAFDL